MLIFYKFIDDVVIALTVSGVVKVWFLTGNETRSSEPIYEEESKPIRCLNSLRLTCCAFNQRTILIVCAKFWQVNIKYKYSTKIKNNFDLI